MPGKRILFVDDEPALVLPVTRLLARLGFSVSTACDGLEAMEVLARDPGGVDALVTDLRMPGMSGLELAAAAQGLRPELPIVLCSGLLDDWHLRQAAALGISQCVSKPYTAGELARVLEESLAI